MHRDQISSFSAYRVLPRRQVERKQFFFFLLFVAIHAALGRKNEKNASFEGGDVPERSDRKN